mgnify:CR=1 FL=1|tara:strand:- start:395 stop:571 length:177 start_codon:yes stop_codon:yes gene_type:complete
MRVGDFVRVKSTCDRYGEVTETYPDHGFCYVRFPDDWESECDGLEETYHFDELEIIND